MDSHSDHCADQRVIVQDYSVDPRAVQGPQREYIADSRVVQYSADQGPCKTYIKNIVQTQGSCNIVQTKRSCNFHRVLQYSVVSIG